MSKLGDLLRAHAPAAKVVHVEDQGLWSPYEPIGESHDLSRILALPRRSPEIPAGLAQQFTERLKRPCGTMTLRAIQAWALYQAELVGGLLGAIGVGEGKTLICLLLATVLKAARTVLLIPPQLRDQVLGRDIPALAEHWRIPNLTVGQGSKAYPDVTGVLHVVSYSELSSARTADYLERVQPDLVVCDEAHQVRNVSAARTKRFKRFFKAHPNTKLCALSGTLVAKSIRDFGHLSQFALRDGSPLPKSWPILESWAEALDPGDFSPDPGELQRLCAPGESVRTAFRRRLLETPGVVATTHNKVGASLVFYKREIALPENVKQTLDGMRADWKTPSGEEITDALKFSRYARQLAAGLYLRWIWPRGESLALRNEWLAARRDWHKEVREHLKASIPGQDSPLLCARAAQAGTWPGGLHAWEPWSAIKDQAQPETEAVWVSDFLVRDAARWGHESPGIIWVEHEALGRAVALAGGFPLYGAGDEASRRILDETGKRTIVASRRAHGEGKNLQMFCRQLFTTLSSNPATWEQALGRTHREGQDADEVEVHVYMHTPEMADAFEAARNGARFIEEIKGERQRLSYASLAF